MMSELKNGKPYKNGRSYTDHELSDITPNIMWVGCSDNHVSPSKITGTDSKDIYVHQNMANMVIHTDSSLNTTLDYAINSLKVNHIIICGHYGCKTVLEAMENKDTGCTNNWIRHIHDVYMEHLSELEKIENKLIRWKRFVELNVIKQMINICQSSTIKKALNANQKIEVSGWVFDSHTTHLTKLGTVLKQ